MKKQELTQERLKELLHYNLATGVFTRKVALCNKVKVGDVAGCLDEKGYIRIRVDGKKYRAHRLAWMYVYGEFPVNQIDHEDAIKHHNWISNLREATNSKNQQNIRQCYKNNLSTKMLGSSLDKRSLKYYSHIRLDGKRIHLGTFNTAQEAHERYLEEKRKMHEFNTL